MKNYVPGVVRTAYVFFYFVERNKAAEVKVVTTDQLLDFTPYFLY